MFLWWSDTALKKRVGALCKTQRLCWYRGVDQEIKIVSKSDSNSNSNSSNDNNDNACSQ